MCLFGEVCEKIFEEFLDLRSTLSISSARHVKSSERHVHKIRGFTYMARRLSVCLLLCLVAAADETTCPEGGCPERKQQKVLRVTSDNFDQIVDGARDVIVFFQDPM